MQDVNVVDRLLGQHGALAQRPAQVLLVDAAALAPVDEKLHGLPVIAGLALGSGAVPAGSLLLFAATAFLRVIFLRVIALALAAPRPRRVLEALLGGLPLADRGLDIALDTVDLVTLRRRHKGDRTACAPDAACAPDPVHVDLR